ncbi:MICOS complex subunit MIC10 [Nucella lapillus]
MADNVRSEDVLGQKWDRCVSDTMIKFASGLGLGIVFSVVFFRRRPWPVAFGAGVGLGMGYANCQHDFQNPFFQSGHKVKVTENKQA